MSTILEFAIFPTDKGISVGKWVAKAIAVIKDSGLPYSVGAMGTCVEGEIHEVLDVLKQCHHVIQEDSDRIYITANFDTRVNQTNRIESKLQSVNKNLAEDH